MTVLFTHDFNLQDDGSPMDSMNFEQLLAGSFEHQRVLEGSVTQGRVVEIRNGMALLSVGLKSEGRIDLKDLLEEGQDPQSIKVGDIFDLYVERYEGKDGSVVLSRSKAKRQSIWRLFEEKCRSREQVEGVITGRVKGGFTVDVSGISAFLPGSHVDIRMVKDVTPLMGVSLPFLILKMDEQRNNVVVSRRAVIELTHAESRMATLDKLEEGQVLTGTVRNMTDYGVFVDLGGIDGLLHIKDMSLRRLSHPSELLKIGDEVTVKVIRYIKETRRVSLGMKQLENDPWETLENRYVAGQKVKGRVVLIVDYGVFVEIEPGLEGLVHVSEMSWSRQPFHPSELVSLDQEVDAVILELNVGKRRISLGIKQCLDNPFENFQQEHPVGSPVDVEIKDITEFGLIVGITDTISGTLYKGDLSWDESGDLSLKKYKRGDRIRARILSIDMQKERIFLGVKQLSIEGHPELEKLSLNMVLPCTVAGIFSTGLEVTLLGGLLHGFIRRTELSSNRDDQNTALYRIGQVIDAKIVSLDRVSWKIFLSIRAHESGETQKILGDLRKNVSQDRQASESSLGKAFQEAASRFQK